MRILHVITTLDVGGAEMHILSQVRGQSARGHEVSVAYLKGMGTLERDFKEAGAVWVGRVGIGPAKLARFVSRLRRAELVHSHLLKADMLTAVLATLAGRRRRLVAGKHNDEQVLKRGPVSFVHGLLGNLPRRTIVLSDHVGRFIERHGRVRREGMRRIYYGLDPAPFARALELPERDRLQVRESFGFAPGDVVFICVARFAPQKAHDVLLRAFDSASRESPGTELRLLLVGDDPFGDGRRRAEELAHTLEHGSRVVFAGIRRDVPLLLAASDVFVMSSLWEGLGLVFLEAMAAELPVLASDVSAVPEVVAADQTGVLVPPGDAAELARGMLKLAVDPVLRRSMGRAGRWRVKDVFGLDRMVEETLAVYREVVAGAP